MSHVWGQTVPSNYGRLPASRQRRFASVTDPVEEAIQKSVKEVTEKAIREVTEEVDDVIAKQITPEVIEKAEKLTVKQISEGAKESADALMKRNLKDLATEAGSKETKDLTADALQKGAKDNVDKLPETAKERLGKRALTVGIPVFGAVIAFNDILNSDAVSDYVDSSTGMDCDEKAVEAGYEPGTQEYTDNVSACQEKAAENIAFLGKAVTYGGLGLGALVVLSVLGKIGIFSRSGSSGDEE